MPDRILTVSGDPQRALDRAAEHGIGAVAIGWDGRATLLLCARPCDVERIEAWIKDSNPYPSGPLSICPECC